MDLFSAASKHLPLFASVPLALFYMLFIGLAMRREQSKAVKFILFAVGFRLILSAFSYATFIRSPVGLSYNALGSLLVIGIGAFVVRRRRLFDPALYPLYPLLIVMIISGAVNGSLPTTVGVLAKYGYFLIIVLAMVDALQDIEADRLFKLLLIPLSLQFAFQIVSLVLGITKPGESGGAASYIGGFGHESSFSVGLGCALLALAFITRMNGGLKAFLIVYVAASIGLANYRTAVLAFIPLLAVTLVSGVSRRFIPGQRGIVAIGMTLMMLSVGVLGSIVEAERYADVVTVIQTGPSIIQPPETMPHDVRQLMSGRIAIWSEYIYAYDAGTPIQHMVGFGPESFSGVFRVYAHNTLISALYELGIFGVIAMLFLWGSMFAQALRAQTGPKLRVIAAHVSYFVLAMATMPMWLIEGLLLYALLCGYTTYLGRQPKPVDADALLGTGTSSERSMVSGELRQASA